MSDEHREHLLKLVFAQRTEDATAAPAGKLNAVVHADIIAGLVFAQRPVDAAARETADQYDLGPRGCFILSLLKRGIRYPKDIATVLQVGRSLISSELARLTDAGLIAAAPGEDRRRSELSLTPLGEEVQAAIRSRLVRHLETSLAEYSAEETLLFAKMLREVGRVAED